MRTLSQVLHRSFEVSSLWKTGVCTVGEKRRPWNLNDCKMVGHLGFPQITSVSRMYIIFRTWRVSQFPPDTFFVPIVKDLVGHKMCGLQRSGMGVAWRHQGSSPVVLIVATLTWHWKHRLSSVSLAASCSDVFLLSIFSAQFLLIHRFENCGTFCFLGGEKNWPAVLVAMVAVFLSYYVGNAKAGRELAQ